MGKILGKLEQFETLTKGERRKLLERGLFSDVLSIEQLCNRIAEDYALVISEKVWEDLAETEEDYCSNYCKKPMQFFESIKFSVVPLFIQMDSEQKNSKVVHSVVIGDDLDPSVLVRNLSQSLDVQLFHCLILDAVDQEAHLEHRNEKNYKQTNYRTNASRLTARTTLPDKVEELLSRCRILIQGLDLIEEEEYWKDVKDETLHSFDEFLYEKIGRPRLWLSVLKEQILGNSYPETPGEKVLKIYDQRLIHESLRELSLYTSSDFMTAFYSEVMNAARNLHGWSTLLHSGGVGREFIKISAILKLWKEEEIYRLFSQSWDTFTLSRIGLPSEIVDHWIRGLDLLEFSTIPTPERGEDCIRKLIDYRKEQFKRN